MRKAAVGYAVGKLMQVMGLFLLVPLGIAVYDNFHLPLEELVIQAEVRGFWLAVLIGLTVGTWMVASFKAARHEQGVKEGYAIVTLSWLSLTLISCIPLLSYLIATDQAGWTSFFTHFTDAFFEIMSGFTTTGATILTDVEAAPRSLLFLRALTHWLGGMGIITLAIVVFPAMGVFGYQMFRGEVPGPTHERLYPRLAQTASVLWGVYVLLSAAETVLLLIGGMSLFDAVCHTFATMATGGFSTRNASVAAFQSDFIEWVIIIFMYFAGINFLLHFKFLRGDFRVLTRDREFKFYTAVMLAVIVIITAVLFFNGPAPKDHAAKSYRNQPMTPTDFAGHYLRESEDFESLYGCFRKASFQTLAIVTTTGFTTADFDLWPDVLRFMLLLLMFFGGCAGSTGGGMKMIRVMMVGKIAFNELRKLTQPRLVTLVKIGDEAVDDRRVINVVSFVMLFVALFVITAFVMSMFVPDLTTAFACSIATIGNIGPGLAGVGAIENYAWIPLPGKWILILSMLLGRLEIFTVLILFRPAVWRK
ncbi:MAG: TrkH family potassium uptake protein [Candidatus Zixiibacteriota bacterium]|nr:MAG: TrkH family potassium uptake protein [candidate division Zixibacteria bacterium]